MTNSTGVFLLLIYQYFINKIKYYVSWKGVVVLTQLNCTLARYIVFNMDKGTV